MEADDVVSAFGDGTFMWFAWMVLVILLALGTGLKVVEHGNIQAQHNIIEAVAREQLKSALVFSADRATLSSRGYVVKINDYSDAFGGHRKGANSVFRSLMQESFAGGKISRFNSEIDYSSIQLIQPTPAELERFRKFNESSTDSSSGGAASDMGSSTIKVRVNFKYRPTSFFYAWLDEKVNFANDKYSFSVEFVENLTMYNYDIEW